MIRRPPRSTQSRSSAASDVYKRQLYVEYEKLRVDGFGETSAAGDEVAGGGVGADADGDLFGYGPMRAELLALHVIIERAVDGFGDALEGHFAEGDEVSAAEEV